MSHASVRTSSVSPEPLLLVLLLVLVLRLIMLAVLLVLPGLI